MAEIKVVFGAKDGKSYQKEYKEDAANAFLGKKIGDKVDGEAIGIPGYEFQVAGGSDKEGFPMRQDNDGSKRRRIISNKGVGFRIRLSKGIRIQKSVAGNTVFEGTAQVNLKVVKQGSQSLPEILGIAPKEEKKE